MSASQSAGQLDTDDNTSATRGQEHPRTPNAKQRGAGTSREEVTVVEYALPTAARARGAQIVPRGLEI